MGQGRHGGAAAAGRVLVRVRLLGGLVSADAQALVRPCLPSASSNGQQMGASAECRLRRQLRKQGCGCMAGRHLSSGVTKTSSKRMSQSKGHLAAVEHGQHFAHLVTQVQAHCLLFR